MSVLDVVNAYVVTNEGLPILLHNLSEGEGEELGVAGEALLKSKLINRFSKDARTIVTITGEKDVVIHKINESSYLTILVKRGFGCLVASTLGDGALKCGKCGRSLKLSVVVCDECGAKLPITTAICPFCGSILKVRKCPFCGALIDPSGRPLSFLERIGSGQALTTFSLSIMGKGQHGGK